MNIRPLLPVVLAALALPAAQPIPARPEQLKLPALAFQTPRAGTFKVKLRNGIPAFIVPDPEGQPIVRLTVMYRGGSYLDPKGKEGLAYLFGSQIRRGGTEGTTPDHLDEQLDFLATAIHGRCGTTSGSLTLEVLEKDLKQGLATFMAVLTRPAFDPERLELAKQGLLQDLARRNDSANSISSYQFSYLLRGGDHFSSALATEASLANITREDLRAFHGRLLDPANLVVAASGRLDRKAFQAALDATLGRLRAGQAARVSPPVPVPTFKRAPGLYLCQKEASQSVVALAMPGLRRGDADWPAAMVMNELLGGGGFASRLMKRLRNDEGLTYGVSTKLETGTFWKGDLLCRFQTKNRSVPYALQLIQEEIARLKAEPVSEAEFEVVKKGLLLAFPSRFSDAESVASLFATQVLNGLPEDYFLGFRKAIEAVSREDVQRMAQKYLKLDQMVALVVGSLKEVQEGDPKDHPVLLGQGLGLPLVTLPLRDPLTMRVRP